MSQRWKILCAVVVLGVECSIRQAIALSLSFFPNPGAFSASPHALLLHGPSCNLQCPSFLILCQTQTKQIEWEQPSQRASNFYFSPHSVIFSKKLLCDASTVTRRPSTWRNWATNVGKVYLAHNSGNCSASGEVLGLHQYMAAAVHSDTEPGCFLDGASPPTTY